MSSIIEVLEFVVIGTILAAQVYFAWQTAGKIKSLNSFLPAINAVS